LGGRDRSEKEKKGKLRIFLATLVFTRRGEKKRKRMDPGERGERAEDFLILIKKGGEAKSQPRSGKLPKGISKKAGKRRDTC